MYSMALVDGMHNNKPNITYVLHFHLKDKRYYIAKLCKSVILLYLGLGAWVWYKHYRMYISYIAGQIFSLWSLMELPKSVVNLCNFMPICSYVVVHHCSHLPHIGWLIGQNHGLNKEQMCNEYLWNDCNSFMHIRLLWMSVMSNCALSWF